MTCAPAWEVSLASGRTTGLGLSAPDVGLPVTAPRPCSSGRPLAHLGVRSLLQPPLLPLSLQPLKLFPDFGWRSPPFHNLRAESRGHHHRSGPGREGMNTRRGLLLLTWCVDGAWGPATPSPWGLRDVKETGMSVYTRRLAPGPGEAGSPGQLLS